MSGAGHMGADFINYYKGRVKMGDTPSLLYIMDGNPDDPERKTAGEEVSDARHIRRAGCLSVQQRLTTPYRFIL